MNATEITARLRERVMLSLEEVSVLMSYGARSPGVIVDIGTYQGGSAIALASGGTQRVYSIDIHEDHETRTGIGHFLYTTHDRRAAEEHIESFGLTDRIELVRANSTQVGLEWDTPIGVVFVDADPADAVENVRCWSRHVVPGGWMILHDVGEPTVQDAAAMLLESGDWSIERARDRLVVYRKRVDAPMPGATLETAKSAGGTGRKRGRPRKGAA